MRENAFDYVESGDDTTTWYVNFADQDVFGYYGGPLLAQDEHQVIEHPILGSLREYLLKLQHDQPELAPRTWDAGPTPYLIKGAQRSLTFDTIRGPYGNAFAQAPWHTIHNAARFLAPPTWTNIVAMAAPAGGRGRYSKDEIRMILLTAFVGFAACRAESQGRSVVHTGNWGCGAFGGHPVLMALLQIAAANLAGLDELVYHTFEPSYTASYRRAVNMWHASSPTPGGQVEDLIERMASVGFEWGVSNRT
jgi:hypothetical protein